MDTKIALQRPFLSGPPDLADLVRNSKTKVKGRFQRSRNLPWFEPHLPEIRTSAANTLIRRSDARAEREICAIATIRRCVTGKTHQPGTSLIVKVTHKAVWLKKIKMGSHRLLFSLSLPGKF